MTGTGEAFEKLVDVMRTLRSPDGCPWDREQTLQSLTHFVLEEAHEVVDAIERGDMADLREEIGDHIFEGVFLAQVAAEAATAARGVRAAARVAATSSGASARVAAVWADAVRVDAATVAAARVGAAGAWAAWVWAICVGKAGA